MKHSLLTLAILAASHSALAQVQGQVVNEQGQPIANAQVDVVGSKLRTTTNERGEFNLPQATGHLELHVKAPEFSHRSLHVNAGSDPVRVTLARTALEVVNVIGLPWHASNMESAQPVSVLSGDTLRSRQAATLGDTLKQEVGVHTSYYGPVASSPIIRGLDGPRVLITQNGLDAGDASRVGPDHAVATEASTARQIEILRGPSTLFYGSGAIGGVVNIVDDRVPQSNDTEGEWRVEHNSVADDKLVSGSITTGTGDIAVHLDGFWRDADDYKIPGPAAAGEKGGSTRLPSSAYDAQGFNLGGSYLLDNGFVGLSVGRLERTYGIPGHSHGVEDVPVHADLEQDRVQLISELDFDHALISGINTRIGYTDYRHDEIEADEISTTFTNKSIDARIDVFHQPLADWRGALTLHYKRSDFSATGLEAFTPPSLTDTWALALIEERHFGPLLVQLGARIEHTDISADNFTADLARLDDSLLSVYQVDHSSTPFSLSGGVVWDFTDGYNLGASFTHAQRTPSAAELFSYGAHIGSGLFEGGALLTATATGDGGFALDLQRSDIELEKSSNIDISLRKISGDFAFITNIFYNRVDDYYYLKDTGFNQSIAHEHGDHYHYLDMPLYIYEVQDADLYGFEGEFIWQASDNIKLTAMTDYIRAKLRDGGDLPRIPPLRIGGRAQYDIADVAIELSVSHYMKQDRVAALEDSTAGYTLVDLQVNYDINRWLPGASLYVKGQNLSDEYARVHASFLKDKAPLPARSFAVGISGKF